MTISRFKTLASYLTTAGLLVFCSATASHATTISMTATDASGQSGFTSGTHWSDSTAPHAGADYTVGASLVLRTPTTTGDFTFAGDSLTISAGSGAGGLAYCGNVAAKRTITVNNLILNGGRTINIVNGEWNLAGNITLGTNNGYFDQQTDSTHPNRKTHVTANVAGSGALYAQNLYGTTPIINNGGIFLEGVNSYSGGTSVLANTLLGVTKDGGLGAGDVSVAATGVLALGSGVTNNYIRDTAALLLANNTNSSVQLNFTGADSVGKLSFDGGLTFAAKGTWGAVGSGAQHEIAVFSGTGMIHVVPEPSSCVLLFAGIVGFAAYAWRKNRYLFCYYTDSPSRRFTPEKRT